jgi:hypothetical protein
MSSKSKTYHKHKLWNLILNPTQNSKFIQKPEKLKFDFLSFMIKVDFDQLWSEFKD